jgi:polar amino acid transport system permease protein
MSRLPFHRPASARDQNAEALVTGSPVATEYAMHPDVESAPRAKARPHVGWWAVSAAVLVLLAMFAHMLVVSPHVDWPVVAHYFRSDSILLGLLRTLELTAAGMLIGIVGGVLLAVMRLSPIPVLSSVSWLYVWFFRGTPLLVQIIFWYNLAALMPTLAFGVPFGPHGHGVTVNTLITPLVAGILGLGLNEAAYMAEIVRGGILSVDSGQHEAASALGMTWIKTMRHIIIPQAMRVIVPPTGNQVIGMLKSSALVSVTSMPELLYSVQLIYNNTFQTIPLLIVASLWYLIVTTVLYAIQFYVERAFARGSTRSLPPTPLQRIRAAAGSVFRRSLNEHR